MCKICRRSFIRGAAALGAAGATGLFSSPDPNLESEVREEAERQLQQSALVDGILKSADQNARNTVTGMLTGLGFTQVALQ